MAEITAALVKSLRDKTGAGMADCKQALTETAGDLDAAVEFLRKKGAASAAKRADRDTNEGRVVILSNDERNLAVMAAVTCETDFVALNQDFVDFVGTIAKTAIVNTYSNLDELKALKVDNETIEDKYNAILSKFSEKIEIARACKYTTEGYLETYVHHDNKLGVIIEVSANNLPEAVKLIIKDIALQTAAMNPLFLDRSFVTQDVLDKEIEIYTQQAIEEGKKPELAGKIALGKVEKFYKESCLLEQEFFKDSKKSISDLLKEATNLAGFEVKITKFTRYVIGEK